jgi:hypothetical protein
MGCKKTVVKIAKRVGEEVGPALVRFAVDSVRVVERASVEDPDFWTSDTKRRAVGNAIVGEAKETGKELRARTVNLLTEFAVEAVKGPDDEQDIGIDDLANREEV